MTTTHDRYRGCLLGGAVGDALGAGIEFMSLAEIRRQYGPAGVTGYVPCYGRSGAARLRPGRKPAGGGPGWRGRR
jgi:ADP-ribosylglycohydrolase